MDARAAIVSTIVDRTGTQHCGNCQKPGPKHIVCQRFIAHYKRIPRNRFALEITLIVIVKALILYGFWFAFFSQPLAKHMRVSPAQMDNHMIAGTDTFSNATPSSHPLSNEVSHDSHR
jgi:hypothetical protein